MLRRIILTTKFLVFQNTSLNQIFCFFQIKLKLKCLDIEAKNDSFYGLCENYTKKVQVIFHYFIFRFYSNCFIKYKKKKFIAKKTNPIYPKTSNHKVSLIFFGPILELQHQMNSNILFVDQEMSIDLRKKMQRGADILFPKIYYSSTKKQPQSIKKKISSDKDVYFSSSNKKNISNLTNINFYGLNPKELMTGKINTFEQKKLDVKDKIKQIIPRKPNVQLQKYNQIQLDIKLRLTQRDMNNLRKTFFAPKSQNVFESKDILLSQNFKNSKKIVGNYQITKQIGHGGFAKVYEVIHKETNTKYAMKQYVLADSLQCYQKEAKVGQFYFKEGNIRNEFSRSSGAHSIIKFVQRIKNNKKGYIIQQIGGVNFSKLLSEIKGTFHNKQRVYEVKFLPFYEKMKDKQFFSSIIIQICQSIKLLNGYGFVHCDLKLENILVEYKENQSDALPIVKVIDFGSTFEIAKGLPKITITPEYMPPQLLMQFDKNGMEIPTLIYQKIDVWSIGCIMFEIFTGVPLWFRYKCKICTNERTKVELGIFALTNRDYSKIIKKQQQLCDSIVKSTGFVSHEWLRYRGLLRQIFVMNPEKRISVEELIERLKQIK